MVIHIKSLLLYLNIVTLILIMLCQYISKKTSLGFLLTVFFSCYNYYYYVEAEHNICYCSRNDCKYIYGCCVYGTPKKATVRGDCCKDAI